MSEIVVNFRKDFDTENVSGLRQWNYGQVLKVEGLELPDGNIEVHFSLTEYDGKAPVRMGTVQNNVITVVIPDFILAKENVYMPTYEAYAWVYVTDGESGETIRKIVFTIESRAEPTADIPENQKDKFLEEVRSIMNETKEIAQSVRDDADNGAFDGEKGDKGDPGAIQKLLVPELPTENIDENTVYLIKDEEASEEDNKYIEYQYIDGEWEKIGVSTFKVDLSEYIKKLLTKSCVYANDENGNLVAIKWSTGTLGHSIVRRDGSGFIHVGEPVSSSHVVNKSYVDKIIKRISEIEDDLSRIKNAEVKNIVPSSAGVIRLEKKTVYMVYCTNDDVATINTYGAANIDGGGAQISTSGKMLSITCGDEEGTYVDSIGNKVIDEDGTVARFFASAVDKSALGIMNSANARRGCIYKATDSSVYAELSYPAGCTITIQKY